jgi:hypothetical protein
MGGPRLAAWGAGASVVLASVSAALINELHGGWQWWTATTGVVLITAALSAWLALRGTRSEGDRLGPGAVKAGRDIKGSVETHADGGGAEVPRNPVAEGDHLDSGAVKAGRDIWGGVRTDTEAARRQPES